MIITKSWLNEWVDVEDKSVEELCKTLNQIGLEVDSSKSFSVPDNIVIGFVLECEKHPEADKLNVCQVDVGTGVRQIVCGASNVREGIYVAVAMIGAIMPDGLEIKPVKLRGVESDGMICASTELGLPDMGSGIMILDESVGELKAGVSLQTLSMLNDDVIEIELTANRGDCLSHKGVARDLAAAYGRVTKKQEIVDSDYRRQEKTTRIMHFTHQIEIEHANVVYRSFKYNDFEMPLKMRFRMALVEESYANSLEGIMLYSTISTGVVFRAYDHKFFTQGDDEAIAEMVLRENDQGVIILDGETCAASIGMTQAKTSKVNEAGGKVILEASYIDPEIVSRQVHEEKIETDPLFYRTSRGSDDDILLGITYCTHVLMKYCGIDIMPGTFEYLPNYTPLAINVDVCSINTLIGDEVPKAEMVKILSALGMEIIRSQEDNLVVQIPRYRHDIKNEQDIVEEIVRMVGIDNIKSKPVVFVETPSYNEAYEKHIQKRDLRTKAAANGFYEALTYLFTDAKTAKKYGYKPTEKNAELINPIVENMDTLRPTILISLIEAASRNMNLGQKSVQLFEYGTIFDTQREESLVLSLLFSGDDSRESLKNQGRPELIDFAQFTQKIADIIGDFKLESCEPYSDLVHPYQSAQIVTDAGVIGKIFKLHPKVADEFDLPDTYLCEVDVDGLAQKRITAQVYSKYQAVRRDISVVAPNDFVFSTIEKTIDALAIEELTSCDLIDIYEDEALDGKVSVTLRFVLQSLSKTLKDKEITAVMEKIIQALDKELGFVLR
ncbi:MAG: phenylalanine--tRNA ligase subunit beta [Thiovulaceae bacterium]|nr:phenylalanine--tRNA ligase subunit beta [Sulfurimonadaceae bacterium]